MKRSEMVNLIQNYTREFNGECWDSDFEECILKVIEEAGMLPPNDGKKRYIKKSSVPCVINARNCHQWEAEDE